jgi:hypothetical protein
VGRDSGRVSDPYAALVELSERELELARAGDAEGLFDLRRIRDDIVGDMPAQAPESARSLLELAARLQLEVTRALAEQLKGASGEMRRLDNGRASIRRYAGEAPSAALVDRAG